MYLRYTELFKIELVLNLTVCKLFELLVTNSKENYSY